MKRVILLSIVAIPFLILFLLNIKGLEIKEIFPFSKDLSESPSALSDEDSYNIVAAVLSGETMETIFKKYELSISELNQVIEASRDIYNLSRLRPGSLYSFKLDSLNNIKTVQYAIDDSSILRVQRNDDGFMAEKIRTEYARNTGSLYITVRNNLISSMPSNHFEYLKLALKLSDIFAWDIDFSSDIMENDTVKIIVEELWLGNAFKGFGNILAAEFYNNGKLYSAYRFEHDDHVNYYDANGKSLRKALLRSPLKFKYISSHFSTSRYHPILRIYRPHLGVDYAAPTGTPVSAAGDGVVVFAGYKGQYGKMVRIKHKGGFETDYGHLSRIPTKIKKGVKVSQGEIIGYVGSTGLATGPHLDYRMTLNGKFVNPLKVELPREESIPEELLSDFKEFTRQIDMKFALLSEPFIAASEERNPLDDNI